MNFVKKSERLSEIVDCTFSPHNKPVMRVSPGEEVRLETRDCFADAVVPGHDLAQLLKSGEMLYDNPVTGPVFVEGAERVDTLVVEILDIRIPERGLTAIVPGFGALEGGWTGLSPRRSSSR